jgi:hypothetical protein
MTSVQKTVFDITREFVEEVKKQMIDQYLLIQEDTEQKFMLDALLKKYAVEAEKAEKDECRSFEQYLKNDKYITLEVTCLNHARHYKLVIIDILQNKLA